MLVLRSLNNRSCQHPTELPVIPSIKTMINADHNDSKITLIYGGDSGHEAGLHNARYDSIFILRHRSYGLFFQFSKIIGAASEAP